MNDPSGSRSASNESIAGKYEEPTLTGIDSTEELGQPIRVIPPATRLLAVATTIVCLAALSWAVFGSVPTRIIGRGVVLSDEEGNFSIASVAAGPVLDVLVRPGDRVLAGTPIAIIEQKLLMAQI